MSNQSFRLSNVSRRQLVTETLAALGAGATAGLAGCSGDNGSGSTPTEDEEDGEVEDRSQEDQDPEPEPEVEHVETGQLAEEWLNPFPDDDPNQLYLIADSYSPSQIREKGDTTLTENQGVDELIYDHIEGLGPENIPETFHQHFGGLNTPHTIKVDQLPAGITADEIVADLNEAGYGNSGSRGSYNLLAKGGDQPVIGVNDDFMVSSQPLNASFIATSSGEHRETLVRAIDNYREEGTLGLSEEVQTLKDELELKDSFGVLKNQNLQDGVPYAPNFDMVGALDEWLPEYGAITLDVEEGEKYGAWLFEDERTAERATEALRSGDEARFGWGNLEYDGRIMTAEGPVRMEESLDENTDGYVVPPVI